MLHDENPGRSQYGHKDLSITWLAFIALMFFLIAGVNVYMQDNRDIASRTASMLKAPPAASHFSGAEPSSSSR